MTTVQEPEPITLVDKLWDRANRSSDPHVAVLSALRTLSTHISFVGSNPSTSDDPLWKIYQADADVWLTKLADDFEARIVTDDMDTTGD